ncbi:MAG TPA: sulfatase-like hydrolase/transferase, partial [Planctomycetota bacterium]|nr:sulfatase-like hydrolase/transferase [Planctomycetota bacterium]
MSGDPGTAMRTTARRSIAFALLAVAWAASAGGLLGAKAAWAEIEMHGYAELGFWRSTASLLRESSLPACALGAQVAFVLGLVWILLKDARAPSDDEVVMPKRPFLVAFHRGEVLAMVLTLAIACIGLLLERGMRPEVRQLAAVLIATFATWFALATASQRRDLPLRSRLRPAALAFVAFALYVTSARWAARLHVDVELGASIVVVSILIFFALLAWSALQPRPRAWVHALLWLGAVPALCLPFTRAFLPKPTLQAARGAPNVLVIGIDSLRLDHTAFSEHPASARELTPNLARLAARGTVFQNAISQAPWTMPSFASIFTGKYPHEHGAVSAKGFLREREMTLAEILREAGYATAGIVSHDYVNGPHGFAQGCEHFDAECVQGENAITSSGVSDRAIE